MRRLYYTLSSLLITKGYVTQEIVNIIARVGTRKEYIWKRHILDLCEFVIENRQIDDKTRLLLEKAIKLTKK